MFIWSTPEYSEYSEYSSTIVPLLCNSNIGNVVDLPEFDWFFYRRTVGNKQVRETHLCWFGDGTTQAGPRVNVPFHVS